MINRYNQSKVILYKVMISLFRSSFRKNDLLDAVSLLVCTYSLVDEKDCSLNSLI